MKKTVAAVVFASLALLALPGPSRAASPPSLAPAAVAAAVPLAGSLDRDPVVFSVPAGEEPALAAPAPAVAESREFWRTVTAEELRAGAPFTTTAPGAVVRLSPVGPGGGPVDPALLVVETPRGERLSGAAAFRDVATADQLRRAGVPFPEGSTAFRLREEAGYGAFRLEAPALETGAGRYLLHVLDRDSLAVLSLRTLSDTVFYGGALAAEGWLADAGEFRKVTFAEAQVASPDGSRFDAPVKPRPDGSLSISLPMEVPPAATPGLWELHLRVRGEAGGQTVERNVHTAFAYVIPTARRAGPVAVVSRKGRLTLEVPVEAAVAGRYALRALVLGRDGKGALRPLARLETAAWVEAGPGSLRAEVAPEMVRKAGLRGPFEVREVWLLDQSRLQVLEKP
ncbi:MAG: DUF4785 domain-containing protein [Acidobacteriota bacterium]